MRKTSANLDCETVSGKLANTPQGSQGQERQEKTEPLQEKEMGETQHWILRQEYDINGKFK